MSDGELFKILYSPIVAKYVKITFQYNKQGEILNFKVVGGGSPTKGENNGLAVGGRAIGCNGGVDGR